MFSLMFELFQEATCRSLGADPAIVNARDEGSFPVFPFSYPRIEGAIFFIHSQYERS